MRTLTAYSFVAACTCAATAHAQVPAGAEFRVNTYTTGQQIDPSAAMTGEGAFVIVWTSSYSPASQVRAQRFSATGAPLGGEFRASSATTGGGFGAVAVEADGDFVVAWSEANATSAQRFDAGGAPRGSELRLDAGGAGLGARVASDPHGNFVGAWIGSTPLDPLGVAGRRVRSDGVLLGAPFHVNTYTTGQQNAAAIAMAPTGQFVVTWGSNYTPHDVSGQRFDAAGSPSGGEFTVNAFTTGGQGSGSVAMDASGNFVVVWHSYAQDGSGEGIFGRRFDSAGAPVGAEFRVNTYTTGEQFVPHVGATGDGGFVVVWNSLGQDGDGWGVFGQRFDLQGARLGAEFRVNSYTTGEQIADGANSIAVDAVGNFVVAWEAGSLFTTDIHTQRFGGLSPTALRVETNGNGILEPGELGAVRPTWRNQTGSAQTFDGRLDNPSGPSGGVPLISNGLGVYGTVADGAEAECTTCYFVVIPDPSPRPVLHWDGTADETILPIVQGQQKRWRLHVGESFTDVPPANGFYRFVETLLHHHVTGGCGVDTYCPAAGTTREQVAVFVLVAREGAGYAPPACAPPTLFADVPETSPFCRWIEELARRGVVSGCGGGNYCPASSVSREQMPIFVLRTLDPTLNPPACVTPMFGDVPASSPFCRWIEELARRGVVTGCGGGNYCPVDAVTREQMGVFIAATFGLALYGP